MPQSIAATSVQVDGLLSALCALVAAGALTLLVLDVNVFVREPVRASDSAWVAKLQNVENDVRRRSRDMPVWGSARQEEELHLKDYVFTDKGSGAVLAFNDKTSIELGENTLVAIEKVQERSVLNVIKGSLRARTAPGGEPVVIKIDGQETLVRSRPGSDLQLRVKAGQPAELTVVSGQAEVGDHQTVVSAQERTTFARSDDVAAPVPLAVHLSSPADGALLGAGAAANLTWEASGPGPFTVEIAADAGFTQIVSQASVPNREYAVPALKPGIYQWRVTVDGQSSEERRFQIARPPAPELYEPADGQTVTSLSSTTAVRLTWETLPGAPDYEVQLATDASFTNVLKSSSSRAPAWTTMSLSAGSYAWRVRGQGAETWSQPATFHVVVLPPPVPPEITEAPNDPLRLAWQAADGARSYMVEIRDGSRVVTEQETHEPTLNWQAPTSGTYQWRVRAKDAFGRTSAFSTPRALHVDAVKPAQAPEPEVKPVLKAPILPARLEILLPDAKPAHRSWWERLRMLVEDTALGQNSGPVTSVVWPEVEGAHAYRVEVALDPTFRDLVVRDVVDQPEWHPHALTPGEFYLHVAAIGEDGELGPFSTTCILVARRSAAAPMRIAVDVPPPEVKLAPPERKAPVDGETLALTTPRPVVTFTWQSVRGAAAYDLQVARNQEFEDLVAEKHTRGQDLSLELKPGTYYWRLRTIKANDAAGDWADPWRFTVSQVLPPGKQSAPVKTKPVAARPEPASQEPASREPASREAPSPVDEDDRRQNGRLSLALAPTRYHYAASGDDPKTRIDATLFNSFQADGRWQAASWLAPDLQVQRASTVLFRKRRAGDPSGQKEITLSPMAIDAGLGLTFGAFEVRPGYLVRSVARFRRQANQTLAVDYVRKAAASLGLGLNLRPNPLWDLRLGGRVARGAGSRVASGELVIIRDFRAVPFGLELGLNTAKAVDKLGDKEVETGMTAVTLGLDWRW